MPEKLDREIIEFERLDAAGQSAAIDELGVFSAKIFEGKPRSYFEGMLYVEGIRRSRILALRDSGGQMQGFSLVRCIVCYIDDRTCDVFRATAGLAPEFRGQGSTLTFGLTSAFVHKVQNPFREVYYQGLLINPSSYYLFARYAHEIWPRYGQETPPEKLDILKKLAAAGGVTIDEQGNPYVFFANSNTIESDEEIKRWKDNPRPEVQYFLKMNPRYHEGYGLITLVPLSWSNLLISATRFAATKLIRRIKRR